MDNGLPIDGGELMDLGISTTSSCSLKLGAQSNGAQTLVQTYIQCSMWSIAHTAHFALSCYVYAFPGCARPCMQLNTNLSNTYQAWKNITGQQICVLCNCYISLKNRVIWTFFGLMERLWDIVLHRIKKCWERLRNESNMADWKWRNFWAISECEHIQMAITYRNLDRIWWFKFLDVD